MTGAVIGETRSVAPGSAVSAQFPDQVGCAISGASRFRHRALELDCYRTAQAVALYSPIQNEVDTENSTGPCASQRKKVFLPEWSDRGFGFARVLTVLSSLPGDTASWSRSDDAGLSDADRTDLVVFVPGVVFDLGAIDWAVAGLVRSAAWSIEMLAIVLSVWHMSFRLSKGWRLQLGIAKCITSLPKIEPSTAA